jgi:hypothetical protein
MGTGAVNGTLLLTNKVRLYSILSFASTVGNALRVLLVLDAYFDVLLSKTAAAAELYL